MPPGCQWDPSAECHPIDIQTFIRYVSLPNIMTDMVLLFLPTPKIWGLQV